LIHDTVDSANTDINSDVRTTTTRGGRRRSHGNALDDQAALSNDRQDGHGVGDLVGHRFGLPLAESVGPTNVHITSAGIAIDCGFSEANSAVASGHGDGGGTRDVEADILRHT